MKKQRGESTAASRKNLRRHGSPAQPPGEADDRQHAAENLHSGAEGEIKAALEQRIPLGRYGTPDEVASVITFLCSDDARFVSGSFYTVDGGMTNY